VQQDQGEPEPRREFLNPSSEFEDLLSKFQLGEARHVHTDDRGRRGAKPRPRGRPRNAEISCNLNCPSALDELAQPVVVALQRTGRGHATDHGPSDQRRSTEPRGNRASVNVTRSGLCQDDNSREKCRMSVGTAPNFFPDAVLASHRSSPCASRARSAMLSARYHLAEETSRFILSTVSVPDRDIGPASPAFP
jgi:hypothetical protein